MLYNLSRRGIERDLLPRSREWNMPIMAYSPIEQGELLTDGTLRTIAKRHGAVAGADRAGPVLRSGAIAIPKSGSLRTRSRRIARRSTSSCRRRISRSWISPFPPPKKNAPRNAVVLWL